MKFYLKGSRIAELMKRFSKGTAEGLTSPFLQEKDWLFECYLGLYSTFVVINVYDEDKLKASLKADVDNLEEINKFVLHNEIDPFIGNYRMLELKPKNIFIQLFPDRAGREKLYDALEEGEEIYFTKHKRSMPAFDNALISDNIKFIINPTTLQMQLVEYKLKPLEKDLSFKNGEDEMFFKLSQNEQIKFLKQKLKQHNPEDVHAWLKMEAESINYLSDMPKIDNGMEL